MNRVITIDNFLTEEECVQGIDIINTHEKEPFKDNPTGAATSIHSTYSEQVMNEHSDKLIPIIRHLINGNPVYTYEKDFGQPGSLTLERHPIPMLMDQTYMIIYIPLSYT